METTGLPVATPCPDAYPGHRLCPWEAVVPATSAAGAALLASRAALHRQGAVAPPGDVTVRLENTELDL